MISALLKYFPIIFILIICSDLTAQIKIHRHITPEDGLAQGQISSMMEDSKGYIWIGTFDGVSRWDGKNFMNIQTHTGLPASQVMDIAEDVDGKIYLAAYGGGILVYDGGILDTINTDDGLLTNNVVQIEILNDGSVLFAGDDGSITQFKNNKLYNRAEAINFPQYDVFDIYESPEGKLYFATEKGLVIVEGKSYSVITTEDGLITDYLWSVEGDSKGTIYIGTNLGINKLIDGKVTSVLINGMPFRNAVFRIVISSDGKIYYASNGGVVIEQNNKTELIKESNGLLFDDTWWVMEGRSGLIYFGSAGKGVSIYDPKEKIINFNRSSGLQFENILSIKEDSKGNYYFATGQGFIKLADNKLSSFTSDEGQRSSIIEAMLVTKNDEVLLGTKGGLKIFKDGKFKPFIQSDELLKNEIYSMAETNLGELYIGTRFGVYYIKEKKVKRIEFFDNLGSIYIMTILATGNDGIYFGSFDKGIFHYYNGNYKNITIEDGLSANLINCFLQRKDGTIWVGTQKGLNIIKNDKVINILDVNDGLTNDVIADIKEDKNGRIFISTYNGLNIVENLADSLSIRSITYKDGLVNNNCNQNASYIDDEGKLWIGTKGGVTIFNPNVDEPIAIPPKIYLTGFEIFNEEYPLKKLQATHELEYDQNYLKFIYTGIDLSAPEKIVFEYRLSDVDKGWVKTNENSVQYTSLDDGDYIFEVRARNEWGYWSEPAQLSFTINPVWWKTWWFTILLWIIAAGTIGGTIRYIEKRKLQKKIDALERERALEKERARISQDMHDDVATSLSEIAILSEILKKDMDKTGAEKHLSDISDRAAKVIDNIGQIIWAINPRNDPLENLVSHLRHYVSEYMEKAGIKCMFDIPDFIPEFQLSAESRRNIFLVVKEAMHNIVKHSLAADASFKVLFKNNKIEFVIKDNGKGFSTESKSGSGNGLINMQNRINDIDGEFEIESKPDEGTTIAIKINLNPKT